MSTEVEVSAAAEESAEEKSERSTLRVIGWFRWGWLWPRSASTLARSCAAATSSTIGRLMTSIRTPMSSRWASWSGDLRRKIARQTEKASAAADAFSVLESWGSAPRRAVDLLAR